MRITIYNANDSFEQSVLDGRVSELVQMLSTEHEVKTLQLRELNLKYCNGCWGCWVKSPGRCQIQDDMARIHESFINSDLVIFAAPMRMGFPCSLMKKVNDRLVPLVHPYIELVNNECHHVPRYEKYPYWGLLLEEEEGADASDLDMVSEIYKRTALNLKSSLLFTLSMSSSSKEIAYEINHI